MTNMVKPLTVSAHEVILKQTQERSGPLSSRSSRRGNEVEEEEDEDVAKLARNRQHWRSQDEQPLGSFHERT